MLAIYQFNNHKEIPRNTHACEQKNNNNLAITRQINL